MLLLKKASLQGQLNEPTVVANGMYLWKLTSNLILSIHWCETDKVVCLLFSDMTWHDITWHDNRLHYIWDVEVFLTAAITKWLITIIIIILIIITIIIIIIIIMIVIIIIVVWPWLPTTIVFCYQKFIHIIFCIYSAQFTSFYFKYWPQRTANSVVQWEVQFFKYLLPTSY